MRFWVVLGYVKWVLETQWMEMETDTIFTGFLK